MPIPPQPHVQGVPTLVATTALGPTNPNALQSVSTFANALPPRCFGFVADENRLYTFNPASVAVPAPGSVVLPGDVNIADPGRWEVMTGGGGGSLVGAPLPYVVQPAGSLPDLAAAGWQNVYPTITEAIAAAVADGHDKGDPATITILPGAYTENFTVPSGLALKGFIDEYVFSSDGPPLYSYVRITGSVHIEGPGDVSGVHALDSLTIVGQVTFSTEPSGVVIRKVFINNSEGVAMVLPSGGTLGLRMEECLVVGTIAIEDEGLAAASVSLRQCTLTSIGAVAAIVLTGNVSLTATDCVIEGSVFGDESVGNITLIDTQVNPLDTQIPVDLNQVDGTMTLIRCTLRANDSALAAIRSDTTSVNEALTVLSGEVRTVVLTEGSKLTSFPTLGLGKADTETFSQVIAVGAETLLVQVPFPANYQGDKIFHMTAEVFPSSSSTITYRVALADNDGVDIEDLALYDTNDPSSPRIYLHHVHAPIASPPLSAENVLQSGLYNIRCYVTVAGSNTDFTGVASVYGASPQ